MKYIIKKVLFITSSIIELLIPVGIANNYISEGYQNIYIFWMWFSFFFIPVFSNILIILLMERSVESFTVQ